MKLILVPHSCDQNSAKIWLCATDVDSAPADFPLSVEKVRDFTIRNHEWRAVEVGDFKGADLRTFVQACSVTGLQPHTRYHAVARGVRAMFSTLPLEIPREDDAFNLLLTSCFYLGNEGAAVIGTAVDRLPPFVKPHVKVLCGDQVYLDVPEVTALPLSKDALSRLFLGKYLRNWGDETGYQVLLGSGSSYFTADDHEFWNNHPNRAFHIPNTWTKDGRDRLQALALALFENFQCEDPGNAGRNRKFRIGRLSFLIADNRVHRQQGDKDFMDSADLNEIVAWVRNLPGPGVLVIGQPLFEKPVGWLRRTFVDRVLPDYGQYKPIVVALSQARHTVLLLTGDVHYSRIATAVFKAGVGPEVIEVIASPSAVVRGAPGNPKPAPERFPAESISGVTSAITHTLGDARGKNNFAILQFFEAPPQIKVRIRHWYTELSGVPQPGPEVERALF